MHIETERLIIRNLTEQDAEDLLDIKYDKQVLKYDPTFIKRDATINDIQKQIELWRKTISPEETQTTNGILVYQIEPLCVMKIIAYTNRDKIRDLYDVTFICMHYYDKLSPQTIAFLRNTVECNGIEDQGIRTLF
jgi:hypothetical protein